MVPSYTSHSNEIICRKLLLKVFYRLETLRAKLIAIVVSSENRIVIWFVIHSTSEEEEEEKKTNERTNRVVVRKIFCCCFVFVFSRELSLRLRVANISCIEIGKLACVCAFHAYWPSALPNLSRLVSLQFHRLSTKHFSA